MMRDPRFQVSKRKKEVGLYLFKKRKRGVEADDDEYFDVNGDDDDDRLFGKNPTFEGFEGNEAGNSSLSGGGGLGFGGEEIGENSRNVDDGEKEVAEEKNPSLDCLVGGNANVVGGDEEKSAQEAEESLATSLVVPEKKKDSGDTPPDDDCCPICFDNFSIACKTNCGHWFCAKCILQFWTYRTVLQKCKCPICTRPISKLTPEASLLNLQEVEVIEVLNNVQRYNRLFQGGVNGVIRLLMSCLYNICSLDFIPTGSLGVRRLFDLCAIGLVVILCLVGICHRLMLRRRVRRLAGNEY